ncbi:MAG: hypothetical protein HYV16_12810 [Gammaproteobacteria bacterium]|nr:hypothetical protein [Gammaproteobacteria bacterium]
MPFEPSSCVHDKDLLLAAAEGRLSAGELAAVEAQCRACPACAADLEQMRFLHQAAAQWQDAPVPDWNRAGALPRAERPRLAWPQWLSLGASFAALVLALSRVDVRHDVQGWSLSLGEAPAAAVADAGGLERRLKTFELSQAAYLEGELARRDEAQAGLTRELLKAVATQNQRERRTDIDTLLAYWREQQESESVRLETKLNTVSSQQLRSTRVLSGLLKELNAKESTDNPDLSPASTTESL